MLKKLVMPLNHVNINPNLFLISSIKYSCLFKSLPEDFNVYFNSCINLESEAALYFNGEASVDNDNTSNIVSKSNSNESFDFSNVINGDLECKLANMNNLIRVCNSEEFLSNARNQSIVIPDILEKPKRNLLHEYLRQKYPMLVSQNTEANEVSVRLDCSLYDIFNDKAEGLLITVPDLVLLYEFYKLGPLHSLAYRGVDIGYDAIKGHYLTRTSRTALYKILSNKLPCWGSRTVDTNNGSRKRMRTDKSKTEEVQVENSKCMNIFWNKSTVKKSQNKYYRNQDGKMMSNNSSKDVSLELGMEENGEVEDIVIPKVSRVNLSEIRPCTLYLSCMLYKYDTEQLTATHVIAEALKSSIHNDEYDIHVGVHDLAIAGIKDKVANTYQYITIKLSLDGEYLKTRTDSLLSANTVEPFAKQSPVKYIIKKSLSTVVSKLERINHWIAGDICPIPFEITNARVVSIHEPRIAIGNVTIAKKQIQLGDLWGNEFNIMLRDVRNESAAVVLPAEQTLNHISAKFDRLKEIGFPNYFGSQRMGNTASSVNNMMWSDDTEVANRLPNGPYIGLCILQSKFKEACESIIVAKPAIEWKNTDYLVIPKDVHDLFVTNQCKWKDGVKPTVRMVERKSFGDVSLALYLGRQMYIYRNLYECLDSALGNNSNTASVLDVILKQFPFTATRERTIIKGILRYVTSTANDTSTVDNTEYEHVLSCIPFNMRNIYISAYQSWIWNSVCNYRIQLSMGACNNSVGVMDTGLLPVEGDIVLVDNSVCVDSFESKDIKIRYVTADDVKYNHGMDRPVSWSSIVIPLPGKNIVYPKNVVGEYMKDLLREDGFTEGDIEMLKCSGAYRRVLQDVYGHIKRVDSPVHDGNSIGNSNGNSSTDNSLDCIVHLKLPSGSYATTFLRELLNNNDVI